MKTQVLKKSESTSEFTLVQNTKNNSIINILNLTAMKTKSFFLTVVMFVLGLTAAYAQLTPQPVTCLTPDALHPIPGNPYDYEIQIPDPNPGTPWTSLHYQWFVTQDQNFMANGILTNNISPDGGPLFNVTGGSAYNVAYNGPGTAPTINLTWKSFDYDPAQPVFVGILVTGVNDVPCTINNLKVFKIEPLHAFTLDIANVQNGTIVPGYGTNVYNCISDIVSATYQAAPEGVVYDFGVDTFYYAVAAANWANSWQLSVQLANVPAGQTATLEWDYNLSFANAKSIGSGNGTFVAADLVVPQGGVNSVGEDGQTIYLRLIMDHGSTYQGLTDITYELAVNGLLMDANGNPIADSEDIHFSSCLQVDFDDLAQQTLKARPNITAPAMPAPGLLPVQP